MKILSVLCGFVGVVLGASSAFGVSAGTVGGVDAARSSSLVTTTNQSAGLRGTQGAINAYKMNQRNSYFFVTQPDVDTACRERIMACLTDYCGDMTVIPGQNTGGRCQYATESELYNATLLCLQKDTSVLLPQYATSIYSDKGGVNTAANLCPKYVQQELMSFLSMSNMATQLSKSHSELCIQRRQELEAAMSCHSVALAYGNETTSKLNAYLTDYCGAGIPGGSAEMVTRFANAGNIGGDIWGWAEKIVSLNINQKGADWQNAVDAVLAGYMNRMNLACGDNMQMNTTAHTDTEQYGTVKAVAALATGVAFPTVDAPKTENPFETQPLYMEIRSMTDVYTFNDAQQVINAGLTNAVTTQNAFLTSAQMNNMQTAYTQGTKVFVLRDSGRCYVIPVGQLSTTESGMIAQNFANCVSK